MQETSPYRPQEPKETSPYRPHDPGHDYYDAGTYLITLVVRERQKNRNIFGHLNNDPKAPNIKHSALGKMICDEWHKIPSYEATRGRKVKLHAAVCMPDHFHGVIEVQERMDCSLGQIIWGFKVACTKHFHAMQANPEGTTNKPSTTEGQPRATEGQPKTAALEEMAKRQPSLAVAIEREQNRREQERDGEEQEGREEEVNLHKMSRKQRAEYYRLHPEASMPLWDDNYDDTICLDEEHLARMIHYVEDNPRRAILMHTMPHFMQRCLHVTIDGIDYATFGNLFLLRWAYKEQVFCHRKARLGQLDDVERRTNGYAYAATDERTGQPYLGRLDVVTHVPYETTHAYEHEHDEWVSKIMRGATVIVTPGISKGEQQMKNECIEKGYPLIHIQKEPIGPLWKPEQSRFEACSNGRLLILAPWNGGEMGEVDGIPANTDYARFHNLNTIAEMICNFDGEARIAKM